MWRSQADRHPSTKCRRRTPPRCPGKDAVRGALRLCGLLAENSRAQYSHETNVRRTQTGSFSTGHLAGQTGKVMKKKDSKAVTDPRRLRRHSGEMRRDSPDRILGQKADTNGRLVKSKQRLEFSSCLFMLVF